MRALLVFSTCAVHDAINLPECGADEGQMNELIGYLVACRGAEESAARMAVGISQQFVCKEGRGGALIDEDSIDSGMATLHPAGGGPITIVYGRENITEPAIKAIAGANPEFGLLD
jgi:hypothetical protein